MRPLDCPTCHAAADRSGQLVVHLRKAASRLHDALGHTAADLWRCHRPPCPDHAAVLSGHRQAPSEPVAS